METENKERLLKYLHDALAAAHHIDNSTVGLSLRNYEFNNIKWTVERGIEIISEALKRSTYLYEDLPISNLTKIFATRNKIAHEYDLVDPNLLFTIVTKYIPILIDELKIFIKEVEAK